MTGRFHRPTPRREQEARRRGDVPRSRLFGAAGALLGAVVGLWASGMGAAADLRRWAGEALALSRALPPTEAMAAGASLVARLSAPALAGALIGSAAAGLLLGGLHFELGRVRPRLDGLHPFHRLARAFTPGALLEATRPLVLLFLLALAAGCVLSREAPEVVRAAGPAGDGLGGLAPVAARLVLVLSLVTAAAGGGDALLARARHRARLWMTREEVLEEQRMSEGDPRQRARRRALHRSLLLAGRARGVRSASALVVNPTHLAVALRYAPREAEAPFLVAKGSGAQAQALRREAARWGIPVVRDVALARSLTAFDVGEEIPEELYQAAAAVLQVAASGAPGAPR
ncbi:MAG TPA: EscU/YscU/HrcU family type III secretion system export apparatus switch protein [Myxococcaceae bacterium]|nr:EscU/YscU/HrcU family type III secretion system export apparatus switch protein [Myxococcaceae bacterium]